MLALRILQIHIDTQIPEASAGSINLPRKKPTVISEAKTTELRGTATSNNPTTSRVRCNDVLTLKAFFAINAARKGASVLPTADDMATGRGPPYNKLATKPPTNIPGRNLYPKSNNTARDMPAGGQKKVFTPGTRSLM